MTNSEFILLPRRAGVGAILGLRAAGPGPGMGCEILGAGSAINWNFMIQECPVHVVNIPFMLT